MKRNLRNLRNVIHIIYVINVLYLFSSCEKEITIDYHEADKRYVVEGSISNLGTSVRISRTNAMNDNSSASDIDNATVVITGDDGTNETIPFNRNGRYTSSLKGTPGVTYQLDVKVNGEHFTSSATMQRMPTVNSFRIVRKKMISIDYIFGDIRLQDIPNENNWYFVHIYRNRIGYRWAVLKDDTNPNKELQQLFGFFQESSSDEDVLRDGESLRVVVRAIDLPAYNFLYSMEQMDETGTNPIDNFSGGCLGYFSAHSEYAFEHIYYKAEIEDEE